MTKAIEFQSRIGSDGVLDFHVPLKEMGAGAEVVVTIRPAEGPRTPQVTDPAQWRRLIDESYGSCAGLGLERQPQGKFESREGLE